jgi:hypothetical protein
MDDGPLLRLLLGERRGAKRDGSAPRSQGFDQMAWKGISLT